MIISPEILEFLRNALKTRDLDVLPLAGDASTRKYYRVVCGEDTYVLMSWEPFEDSKSYPFLNVQAHYTHCGVQVPEVLAVSGNLGIVLLEDLGDLTLERKFWENQNQEIIIPYYKKALDELVKIQFSCSKPVEPKSLCQTTQFDTAKFMWEMNYALEHFIEKLAGIRLADSDREILLVEFQEICETLHREKKYVTHRDYHSRNLMLKRGKVIVIDFQDSRLGPLQYDLVSLLYDSYVQLSMTSIQQLMCYYLELAEKKGATHVREPSFQKIMQVQTIQRCYKACGSFASFFNARRDTRYLKYIRRTADRVAQTLQLHGGYPKFTELIMRPEIVERDFETI